MNLSGSSKTHWQETLESVGVPVSLAEKSGEILQKEAEDSGYERTEEEQETISHAWMWWVAQGMRGGE